MPQQKASESTSGYIREAADVAKAGVDRASDYLEGASDHATTYVRKTINDAQDAMAELGGRRFEDLWRDTLKFTKRRPAAALLMAGAVGLTLGLFAKRG